MKYIKGKIVTTLGCLFFLIFSLGVRAEASNCPRIHILPFLGSDAILLESNGYFGMVDSGEDWDYPDGSDSRYPLRGGITKNHGLDEKVLQYLESVGVTSENFKFYIGTHPHSDHIGTADLIIRKFSPEKVYALEYADEYVTIEENLWDNLYVYDQMLEAAKEVNATLIQHFDSSSTGEESPIIYLGDMKIEIMNYEEDFKSTPKTDANAFSLAVKVTANEQTAFLAGDIGEVWDGDESVLGPQVGHVNLLKLGHHGLSTSNTLPFLEHLSPDIAVQTGLYFAMPSDRLELFDRKGTQFFAADGYQNSVSAMIFEMTSSGIKSNISGTSYYGYRHSYPHVTYYLDGRKTAQNGFVSVDGATYYFENSCYATENNWKYIDKQWYYFGSTGKMVVGFAEVGGETYYMNEAGVMQTGWVYVDGVWYYFSESGAMQTGWKYINGTWYYMAGNGVMQTGWQCVDGTWYYMSESGAMQTGWEYVDGLWYYLSGSGAMQTGWQYIGKVWYYMNISGVMQTGWQYIGGSWYYLSDSGIMQTGWRYLYGEWYYMNTSGAMQTGWQYIGRKWYYMDVSGAMQTGWLLYGNKWYYLSDSGIMLTGRHTIDGVRYHFSRSGALL